LTLELKHLLSGVGLDEVKNWAVDGIEQEGWPRFGPVVKTSEEFRAAYVAFRAKCVSIAREVSGAAAVEVGKMAGRTEGKM
jgi:hypothetical protein